MNRQPFFVLLMLALFFVANVLAEDKISAEKNVSEMIALLDSGREATSIAPDAFTPYVFVMDQDGRLLVHPTLSGEDLKEKARPIYDILQQATPEGMWVEYSWKGKDKRTFIKRYQGRLSLPAAIDP